jgi:hypothetical protein
MSKLNWAVGEVIASKLGATTTAALLIVEHQRRINPLIMNRKVFYLDVRTFGNTNVGCKQF